MDLIEAARIYKEWDTEAVVKCVGGIVAVANHDKDGTHLRLLKDVEFIQAVEFAVTEADDGDIELDEAMLNSFFDAECF